jgi:hypothetical protein
MDLNIDRVEVWATEINDQPGALAGVLAALNDAGADLDFVIARRSAEKPGTGTVFVTPLRGDAEVAAASMLGFNLTSSIASVRIEGENIPGVGAELNENLGGAGINLRGFSAAVIGSRFIAYVGFDSTEDADKAVDVFQQT